VPVKRSIALILGLGVLGAAGIWFAYQARPRELVYQGQPVSAWAFQLHGPIPRQREEAAAAFQQLGATAVPDLIRMVRTQDPLLTKPLHPPPAWLPKPLQRLIYRTIRPADASARRIVAAHALAALDGQADAAVPALGGMLTNPRPEERWLAATALGRIGSPEAVAVCVAALRGTNDVLHHPAVYALGEMRAAAVPALPEVLHCLGHPYRAVRDSAVHTLAQIGLPALAPVAQLVREERGDCRRAAAQALVRISPSPRATLDPLLEMTDDPDPLSRRQALQALLTVSASHPRVVAALSNLLQDADEVVRTTAAEALAKTPAAPR